MCRSELGRYIIPVSLRLRDPQGKGGTEEMSKTEGVSVCNKIQFEGLGYFKLPRSVDRQPHVLYNSLKRTLPDIPAIRILLIIIFTPSNTERAVKCLILDN